MHTEIDRAWIQRTARDHGFHAAFFERAFRLAALLAEIGAHPWLSPRLVLRGGTCIHFFYTDLRRLSVDLDLDYIGSIDRDLARHERPRVEAELGRIAEAAGYQIDTTHASAMDWSARFLFTNIQGGRDAIRVDLNYINRVTLEPTIPKGLPALFGLDGSMQCLSLDETLGSKIAALLRRAEARDLYDVGLLLATRDASTDAALRRSFVFYTYARDLTTPSVTMLHENPTAQDVRDHLYPVLRKDERPSVEDLRSATIPALTGLLRHTQGEVQYLEALGNGRFEPEHLFGPHVSDALRRHPMGLWRARHPHPKRDA